MSVSNSPAPEAAASGPGVTTADAPATPAEPGFGVAEHPVDGTVVPPVHLASATIVVDLPPAEEPDVPDDERALAIDEIPVTSDERARTTTSSVAVPEGARPTEEDDRVDETPTSPAYTGMSVARALAGAPESASMLTAERLLDQGRDARRVPEGFWQKLLFDLSGRRIRLSDSKAARARTALTERIATPLTGGARFVPVLTRKGGVGKTTVTTLMGMALADARDDRVIAVDANPDRGTLAERLTRRSEHTVRDLVRGADDVAGYAEFSALVSRDATRLDVLSSDSDPHISQAFAEEDYDVVARLASQYYSLILTDCGTGIVHSVMGATLRHADTLVVVSGTSIDEARSASETLSWLEANGYPELAAEAVVVINSTTPGTPPVRLDEIEKHFESRVRSIVRVPFDTHLATGAAITFTDLRQETRQAVRELAAAVVEGLPGARNRKAGSRG
ncbi:MinD/ParA family ATP-binding protein [Labedella endophytica]|uniref:MinD/ParA family protein n=1 Tax=Labedella endophytica TaxID=1523160 RepID=A0A3S1CRV7_9MICO|nr:MinD/ParA family protein [Labedella endophytica]RUR00832.1 MinD/ParA family protein [Labedella endophytica]